MSSMSVTGTFPSGVNLWLEVGAIVTVLFPVTISSFFLAWYCEYRFDKRFGKPNVERRQITQQGLASWIRTLLWLLVQPFMAFYGLFQRVIIIATNYAGVVVVLSSLTLVGFLVSLYTPEVLSGVSFAYENVLGTVGSVAGLVLNIVRLSYAAVIPVWNGVIRSTHYVPAAVVMDAGRECIVPNLGVAVRECGWCVSSFFTSFSVWLVYGMTSSSWNLTETTWHLQSVSLSIREALSCTCEDIRPVWDFVFTPTQTESLAPAVSNATNVLLCALIRVPFRAIDLGTNPDWTPLRSTFGAAILETSNISDETLNAWVTGAFNGGTFLTRGQPQTPAHLCRNRPEGRCVPRLFRIAGALWASVVEGVLVVVNLASNPTTLAVQKDGWKEFNAVFYYEIEASVLFADALTFYVPPASAVFRELYAFLQVRSWWEGSDFLKGSPAISGVGLPALSVGPRITIYGMAFAYNVLVDITFLMLDYETTDMADVLYAVREDLRSNVTWPIQTGGVEIGLAVGGIDRGTSPTGCIVSSVANATATVFNAGLDLVIFPWYHPVDPSTGSMVSPRSLMDPFFNALLDASSCFEGAIAFFHNPNVAQRETSCFEEFIRNPHGPDEPATDVNYDFISLSPYPEIWWQYKIPCAFTYGCQSYLRSLDWGMLSSKCPPTKAHKTLNSCFFAAGGGGTQALVASDTWAFDQCPSPTCSTMGKFWVQEPDQAFQAYGHATAADPFGSPFISCIGVSVNILSPVCDVAKLVRIVLDTVIRAMQNVYYNLADTIEEVVRAADSGDVRVTIQIDPAFLADQVCAVKQALGAVGAIATSAVGKLVQHMIRQFTGSSTTQTEMDAQYVRSITQAVADLLFNVALVIVHFCWLFTSSILFFTQMLNTMLGGVTSASGIVSALQQLIDGIFQLVNLAAASGFAYVEGVLLALGRAVGMIEITIKVIIAVRDSCSGDSCDFLNAPNHDGTTVLTKCACGDLYVGSGKCVVSDDAVLGWYGKSFRSQPLPAGVPSALCRKTDPVLSLMTYTTQDGLTYETRHAHAVRSLYDHCAIRPRSCNPVCERCACGDRVVQNTWCYAEDAGVLRWYWDAFHDPNTALRSGSISKQENETVLEAIERQRSLVRTAVPSFLPPTGTTSAGCSLAIPAFFQVVEPFGEIQAGTFSMTIMCRENNTCGNPEYVCCKGEMEWSGLNVQCGSAWCLRNVSSPFQFRYPLGYANDVMLFYLKCKKPASECTMPAAMDQEMTLEQYAVYWTGYTNETAPTNATCSLQSCLWYDASCKANNALCRHLRAKAAIPAGGVANNPSHPVPSRLSTLDLAFTNTVGNTIVEFAEIVQILAELWVKTLSKFFRIVAQLFMFIIQIIFGETPNPTFLSQIGDLISNFLKCCASFAVNVMKVILNLLESTPLIQFATKFIRAVCPFVNAVIWFYAKVWYVVCNMLRRCCCFTIHFPWPIGKKTIGPCNLFGIHSSQCGDGKWDAMTCSIDYDMAGSGQRGDHPSFCDVLPERLADAIQRQNPGYYYPGCGAAQFCEGYNADTMVPAAIACHLCPSQVTLCNSATFTCQCGTQPSERACTYFRDCLGPHYGCGVAPGPIAELEAPFITPCNPVGWGAYQKGVLGCARTGPYPMTVGSGYAPPAGFVPYARETSALCHVGLRNTVWQVGNRLVGEVAYPGAYSTDLTPWKRNNVEVEDAAAVCGHTAGCYGFLFLLSRTVANNYYGHVVLYGCETIMEGLHNYLGVSWIVNRWNTFVKSKYSRSGEVPKVYDRQDLAGVTSGRACLYMTEIEAAGFPNTVSAQCEDPSSGGQYASCLAAYATGTLTGEPITYQGVGSQANAIDAMLTWTVRCGECAKYSLPSYGTASYQCVSVSLLKTGLTRYDVKNPLGSKHGDGRYKVCVVPVPYGFRPDLVPETRDFSCLAQGATCAQDAFLLGTACCHGLVCMTDPSQNRIMGTCEPYSNTLNALDTVKMDVSTTCSGFCATPGNATRCYGWGVIAERANELSNVIWLQLGCYYLPNPSCGSRMGWFRNDAPSGASHEWTLDYFGSDEVDPRKGDYPSLDIPDSALMRSRVPPRTCYATGTCPTGFSCCLNGDTRYGPSWTSCRAYGPGVCLQDCWRNDLRDPSGFCCGHVGSCQFPAGGSVPPPPSTCAALDRCPEGWVCCKDTWNNTLYGSLHKACGHGVCLQICPDPADRWSNIGTCCYAAGPCDLSPNSLETPGTSEITPTTMNNARFESATMVFLFQAVGSSTLYRVWVMYQHHNHISFMTTMEVISSTQLRFHGSGDRSATATFGACEARHGCRSDARATNARCFWFSDFQNLVENPWLTMCFWTVGVFNPANSTIPLPITMPGAPGYVPPGEMPVTTVTPEQTVPETTLSSSTSMAFWPTTTVVPPVTTVLPPTDPVPGLLNVDFTDLSSSIVIPDSGGPLSAVITSGWACVPTFYPAIPDDGGIYCDCDGSGQACNLFMHNTTFPGPCACGDTQTSGDRCQVQDAGIISFLTVFFGSANKTAQLNCTATPEGLFQNDNGFFYAKTLPRVNQVVSFYGTCTPRLSSCVGSASGFFLFIANVPGDVLGVFADVQAGTVSSDVTALFRNPGRTIIDLHIFSIVQWNLVQTTDGTQCEKNVLYSFALDDSGPVETLPSEVEL